MKIILLSYLSRSGSTLICNILIKDKRFCICPEAEVLTRILLVSPNEILNKFTFHRLKKAFNNDSKLKHWNISSPNYTTGINQIDFFKEILTQYRLKTNSNAEFIIFKSEGLEGLDIEKYMNFYKIILLRDPRAIFYSQKNNTPSIGKGKMNINPIRLTKKFNRLFSSKNTCVRSVLLHYENLVKNQEQELLNVSDLLKISSINKDTNIGVINIIPKNQKHLHVNLDKKNILMNLYKWQEHLTKYEIYLIQKHLLKSLLRIYLPVNVTINFFNRMYNYIILIIADYFNRTQKSLERLLK